MDFTPDYSSSYERNLPYDLCTTTDFSQLMKSLIFKFILSNFMYSKIGPADGNIAFYYD